MKTCGKCFAEGEGTWDHDTGCELPVIPCDNCGGTGEVEPFDPWAEMSCGETSGEIDEREE